MKSTYKFQVDVKTFDDIRAGRSGEFYRAHTEFWERKLLDRKTFRPRWFRYLTIFCRRNGVKEYMDVRYIGLSTRDIRSGSGEVKTVFVIRVSPLE